VRNAIHKVLVWCGVALVLLRFVPAKPESFLSKLFFDSAIHSRLDALSMKAIMSLGVTVDQYKTQVAGLASLAHAMSLIAEALVIALFFYVITRWI
jgi:hypothetical protein